MNDQSRSFADLPLYAKVLVGGGIVVVLYLVFTWGITSNPPGFYVDESCIAYNGYLIATTGVAENGTSLPLYFQCYTQGYSQYMSATQPYALALLYLFVPPSVQSARIFAATIVFIAILLLGFLSTRLSGNPLVGLIVVATGVATPWLFEFGRMVMETFFLIFILVFFLFSLHTAFTRGKWSILDCFRIALSLTCVTYSYATGRMIAPILALGLLIFAVNWRGLFDVIKTWVIYALTMIPIIVVYFTTPHVITGRFSAATNLSKDKSILENVMTVAKAFYDDVSLKFFIYEGDVLVRHHIPGMGELLVGTFALGVFGLILILIKRQYRSSPWWRYVLYGAFITMLPGAITYERYHAMRNLAFPIFFFLLLVPAISYLLSTGEADDDSAGDQQRYLSRSTERLFRGGLLAIVLLLTAVQAMQFRVLHANRGTLPDRQDVFNAAYPAIFDMALETGIKPIYLEDGGEPAYIHALWYGAIRGVDRADLIHLLDHETPPEGALVLSARGACSQCEVLYKAGQYILYRNLVSKPTRVFQGDQRSTTLGNGPDQFYRPHGIAIGPDGSRNVADTGNSRIKRIDQSGNFVSQFGKAGTQQGEMMQPHGIAIDQAGSIFVTDSGRHTLLKFKADGTFIKEWRGPEIPFYGPRDIAFGPDGKLYIVDQGCTRIVKFDTVNEQYFVWGTAGSGEGQFIQSTGIAVEGGKVYVADTGNDRVQVFDLDGNFLMQWAVPQWQKDEQPFPDIAVDERSGRIFVSSGKTNEVLEFNTQGKLLGSIKPKPPYTLNNPSSLLLVDGKKGPQLLVVNKGGDDPKIGSPSVAVLDIEK